VRVSRPVPSGFVFVFGFRFCCCFRAARRIVVIIVAWRFVYENGAFNKDMERFKVMKASGSKHSLNKYYGATAEDVENTAGLLEMTNVLDSSQVDENVSGMQSPRVVATLRFAPHHHHQHSYRRE